MAVEVLREIGIDTAEHRSKGMDEIPADEVDTVVTLCAEEVCPVWLGQVRRIHWPLPDPAAPRAGGIDAFRAVRDELSRRLTALFSK